MGGRGHGGGGGKSGSGGAGGRSAGKAGGGGSPGEQVMSGLESLAAKEGSEGALVPMGRLRDAVPLSKEKFDAAVLDLYAKDKVILHHHDYVASLTPKERSNLVSDAYGNHYLGIALSRNR